MSRVRPSGSGRTTRAGVFLRPTTSPRAALVLEVDPPLPADWPTIDGGRASDAHLDHAVGWTCEIRRDAVHVMNPLGEGVFAATRPALSEAWLSEMGSAASAAIYLVSAPLDDDVQSGVDAAARRGPIPAATVRTAVHADFGKQQPVGRNDPCPCGSGRKYKQCHLR